VLKSGSNVFHGSARASYENPSWQGKNITPALAAQGITTTNPMAINKPSMRPLLTSEETSHNYATRLCNYAGQFLCA